MVRCGFLLCPIYCIERRVGLAAVICVRVCACVFVASPRRKCTIHFVAQRCTEVSNKRLKNLETSTNFVTPVGAVIRLPQLVPPHLQILAERSQIDRNPRGGIREGGDER